MTLCPPNIAGPRSGYFLEIVDTMRAGRFAYVDEGRMPCDLIDVENLAHAIVLALTCDEATGERIFVTNDEPTTWRDVVDGLGASAEPAEPIPSLTLAQARELHAARAARPPSVRRAVKHLLSSDVRSALTKDTLFASLERSAKTLALKLPEGTQTWMRGPDPDGDIGHRPDRPLDGIHTRLITQQLRNAYYGIGRARRLLGYEPVVSCEQSLQAFYRWHAAHTGYGSPEWALLRALYAD